MTWRIKKAEFIKAITRPDQAPETRPAVAFAGRSNVGKSSLINKLLGGRRLAKTSSTPGRTREIIFFDIDEKFYFVDLPGYGYAKVSLEIRKSWSPMMERYFRKAEGLRLVVILLDSRRTPSPEDLQMIGWLEKFEIPYIFAVTKMDKLSKNQLQKQLKLTQETLGLADDSSLVPVSATTGAGIDDLLNVVHEALMAEVAEPLLAPEDGVTDLRQDV